MMPKDDMPAEIRPKLSRTRIVEAAIGIVRTEGLDTLSMRRVAATLDAGVMSLYRHVTDRDDLLVGMLDLVAQRIDVPPTEADDRAEIVAIVMTFHRAFREDPWLVQVLLLEGRGSLLVLPLLERMFAALGRLGCDAKSSIDHYSLLLHYAYGESLSFETTERRLSNRKDWPAEAFADYPAAAAVMTASDGWAYDEFERNLKRLVAAI
ncbi:MAG: hypothetical protein AAF439_04605 [Pseudomonadota bacterium]